MRTFRRTASVAVICALTVGGLTACGSSKDEEACKAAYAAQQRSLGLTPSAAELERVCDPNGSHSYGRSYYSSHRSGSKFRGGGSGSGK